MTRARSPERGGRGAQEAPVEAVGWCLYPACHRFAEPVATLARGRRFRCDACRRNGWRETPRASRTGRERPYREVKVLHGFRVLERRYGRQAIVRDEALGSEHRAFVLATPLVEDAKQALDLAESLFWLLNATGDERLAAALCAGCEPPRPWQATISLDASREELRAQLARVLARFGAATEPDALTTDARPEPDALTTDARPEPDALTTDARPG